MPAALTLEQKKARALAESAKTESSTNATKRQRRSAFNGTEGKMQIGNEIPGYHLYVFNDVPGRIQQALDTGYEFVAPEEVGGTANNVVSRNTEVGGDKVRFLVGKNEDGSPMYGYLMKIREEWWEEDQAEGQAKINQVDAALKNGKAPSMFEGSYSPKGGIKLS